MDLFEGLGASRAVLAIQRVDVSPRVIGLRRLEGQLIVEEGDRLLPDDRIDLASEIQDGAGLMQFLERPDHVRCLLIAYVVLLVQLIETQSACECLQCPRYQLNIEPTAGP